MAVSMRNTKNQIMNAYKEALAKVKDLEKQLKNKEKAPAPSTTSSTKTVIQEKVVYKTAELKNLEGIIATLKAVEQGIAPAFSDNSALQAIEAEKLQNLQTKLEEEGQEIQKLYDIEVDADSMLKIIEEYLASQKQFEEEFEAKEKAYKEQLEEQQRSWDKEQELKSEEIAEMQREAEQERSRDKEQYDYQLKQERKIEDDNYKQKSNQLELELQTIQEQKEDAWTTEEKSVKEQEEEQAQYKADFEELEEKLRKEVKKAEAEAKGIVERDHKVKMKMLKTEQEGELSALQHIIDDLNSTLDKQKDQIHKLYAQLEDTQRQAQQLAVKALENSSSADSFKAMREIAMEQAKNMGKGK